MGLIKTVQFTKLVSNDMEKSPSMVQKYLDAIISRLFVEMRRGNKVTIDNFASFTPELYGGYTEKRFGHNKYIEPRVIINFNLTASGLNFLNDKLVDDHAKKRLRNDKLFKSDMEILGMKKRDKKNIEDCFEEVIQNNLNKRNQKRGQL